MDGAFTFVIYVAPNHLMLLLKEAHLEGEGGELPAESLDLFLLPNMHGLDMGVHLPLHVAQQPLLHRPPYWS